MWLVNASWGEGEVASIAGHRTLQRLGIPASPISSPELNLDAHMCLNSIDTHHTISLPRLSTLPPISLDITIAMGVVRTLLTWTGYGSLAGVGTFAWATRGSRVLPLPQTDYLYNTTWYARYNAENNQPVSDVCVRRVPLNQIRPELLEKDGKLVERFCAGVWGGIGEHWPDGRVAKTYRSRY